MAFDFYADLWNESSKINFRNRDKNLEKKVNGTRIEFELTPSNWYSKLKEVSMFYLEIDDQRFKDAYSEYIKGILVHTECNSVVKEDRRNKGRYSCEKCRRENLEFVKDVKRIEANYHLLNDEIYSGELFKMIKEPSLDLSHLPPYSFFLSLEFTLKKPFISKDDEEFYIHENPVAKEKVFKVPYMRASSWKGNLRWVAYKKLIDKLNSMTEGEKTKERSTLIQERLALARIFGNEKDIMETHLEGLFGKLNEEYEKELREIYKKEESEEINFQGRLQFYPTFFNMISLDVINPHDRKTRAGTKPIILEVVPETAEGTFSLLYLPFDLIGNEEKLQRQVPEDLEIICEAIRDLLAVYGFSAKKTSGYGVINTKFNGGFFDMKGIELEKREFEDFAGLMKVLGNTLKKMEGKNGKS